MGTDQAVQGGIEVAEVLTIRDRGFSPEKMIEAGSFTVVDPNITTRAGALRVKHGVEHVLIAINQMMESDDILAELESAGLSPGNERGLLVYGAYGSPPQDVLVIALAATQTPDGSKGHSHVAALGNNEDMLELSLLAYDGGWSPDNCCFLATRPTQGS
jgi:hypothetical protein